MAIVESQKAIAQAETIAKLTTLAFFSIPPTLAASIFGKNMTVSRLVILRVSDLISKLIAWFRIDMTGWALDYARNHPLDRHFRYIFSHQLSIHLHPNHQVP